MLAPNAAAAAEFLAIAWKFGSLMSFTTASFCSAWATDWSASFTSLVWIWSVER